MHRKFQHKVILILISICGTSIIFHHYQRNIVSVQQSQGRPKFILKDIKCSKILQGDAKELKKVHAWNLKHQYVIHPSFYINKTKFCHLFQEEMGYDSYPVTDDEKNFPIAFSLILHKDIEHFEKLLHTIYRPQNIYCLHVDQKSPQDYKDAIWKIADCFPNVFVASKLEAVFYASYSRLQADLNYLLNWMKDIYSPDEYFWATLHHSSLNPHLNVPGSYKGDPNLKKWLASYSAWQSVEPCNGKWVRQICVFSASDLKRLHRRYELFANKFHLTYDPLAVSLKLQPSNKCFKLATKSVTVSSFL
ncbi:GCNT3 [Acanthosepion pharaonis]|uniref:GCNT3 n=1 Tax=Acanthosepion pharaonis TaxID=158019 RepID=A0A812BSW5_ACAPH|nr:GCNT3 [Sepia pharaonis]